MGILGNPEHNAKTQTSELLKNKDNYEKANAPTSKTISRVTRNCIKCFRGNTISHFKITGYAGKNIALLRRYPFTYFTEDFLS